MKAQPGEDALHEARPLRQRRQRLDHPAVHQPEIADILGDLDLAHPSDHTVEGMRGRTLGPTLALASRAAGQHHIVALAPFLHHSRHHLGRVLQVGVHRDHRCAGGEVQPGAQRVLLAEIAREPDHPDARVMGPKPLQRREGAVGRAVVNAKDLVVGGDRFQDRHQACEEVLQHVALVQHRDDDAQLHRLADFGAHLRLWSNPPAFPGQSAGRRRPWSRRKRTALPLVKCHSLR